MCAVACEREREHAGFTRDLSSGLGIAKKHHGQLSSYYKLDLYFLILIDTTVFNNLVLGPV